MSMKHLFKAIGALTTGILLQLTLVMPCFATTNDNYIPSSWARSTWHATPTSDGAYMHDFRVNFYLDRDEQGISKLHVVETITGDFPESDRAHGLVRVIPFTNQDGKNLTMESDKNLAISATRNGNPEPIAEVNPSDGFFQVKIGDAGVYPHGEQTYILEYDYQDVITDQNGNLSDGTISWQELYWDANGNDWANSFDNIIATVHLAPELARKFLDQDACYVGKYGSDDKSRCEVTKNSDNTEITFSASEIKSYENLSFVLAFAPGTFVIPENSKDYSLLIFFTIAGVSSLAIILYVVCMGYIKSKKKREYYKSLFVKPEYAPMKELTVAELADCGIKSFTGKTEVATLMELAVSKKIAIHKEEKEGKFKNKTIWSIKILSDDFLPEQRDILKILNNTKDFQKGEIFKLEKQKYQVTAQTILEHFKKSVTERLENLGFFESDKKVKKSKKSKKSISGVALVAIAIWEFAVILSFIFLIDESSSYKEVFGEDWIAIATVILMIVSPIIVIAISYTADTYNTRTEKGLEAARYLEGLRLYVKMAEAERIKFLQSVDGADTSHQGIVKLYEKLLPYAIIFGLEKTWLGEMGKYYEYDDVSSPAWYIGTGAFLASDFSNAVTEMSSFAGSSISHSTTSNSSSSGSGFSGGGFSGGGGGGGGGGTW